ncbi:MAG: acyltransferase [Bacteroidetes bacterium]|nr:MAG: acyltransferase [Bacteroidota bacterium]
MKKLWYYFMRAYIALGLDFYYKKILVKGKKNITKNKAILFISNHPNALIDPLLVATHSSRNMYYLTQAGVFKNKIVKKILDSVNMIPVYRVRDGLSSKDLKTYNDEVFQYCYQILNKKQALLIYVEGSHNIQRKVRPFRKGFTRIVFGAMDQYNDLEIDIIPVGMNYTNVDGYASKVSINYGKPISFRPFWEIEDRNEAIRKLIAEAENKLKLVTNHISDSENYEKIIQYFESDEFLFPEKVNEKLKFINLNTPPQKSDNSKNKFNLLQLIVSINSFFPLLIWKKIKQTIKQTEYISTFRFAVGITAFPIFFFIQKGIITYFFGSITGWIYLIFSFLSVLLLTKTHK